MNTLDQHIRALLIDNDCVIVPDLGGFIAHYTPAVWMEKENTFIPPARMIGFNSQLKINDGLLVQSYMQNESLNFAEASQKLHNEVTQLISHLHTKGEIMLADLGHLRLSIHNTFEFIPCKQQIQASNLFGFVPFKLQKISTAQPSSKLIPLHPSSIKNEQKQIPKITITASFLSNAVAVAAIIILFFTLSIPIENTEVVKGNYAQLFPTDMFENMPTQSLATTPLAIRESNQAIKDLIIVKPLDKATTTMALNEKKNENASHSNDIIPKASVQSTPTPIPAKNYHIIVASVGTSIDAKYMAEQLVKKGFPYAKAIIGDGKMRVCIDSYTSETEAYRALNKLRQNEAYKNAWILKKKQEK